MAEIFNFYVQDNRSIQFPKNNLLEPIMQEDYKVATWRFRIPKTLNGIDMSAWAWWFVYTNAKNEKFSELLTLVDDIDEPDSYCTADYDIDYGISYNPGSFSFSLEAINAESGGAITGEWHTKTYSHKVDKTLQGNQAEWAETESDIISALIVEVQNKVAQLVGGATPEPKNLVADMTDTKKVYLYVGNEEDESNGYWYYHNGTRFVPGGLYASGITVDSTLSQSGQAADAKVVGDKVTELKEDLSGVEDDVLNINDNLVFTQGGIRTSDGSDSTSNTRIRMPQYIPSNRYKSIDVASGYKCMIFVYSDKSYSTYQGVYDGKNVVSTGVWCTGRIHLNIEQSYYIRAVIAEESNANILPVESSNVSFISHGQIKENVENLAGRKRIPFDLANGQEINPLTGGNRDAVNRVRSDYIYTPFGKLDISMPSNILYQIFEYTSNTYTSYTLVATEWTSGEQSLLVKPNHYYRMVLRNTDDSVVDTDQIYLNGAIYIYVNLDSQNWLNGFKLNISDIFVWSRGSIKSGDGTSTNQNYDSRCRTKLSLINSTYNLQIPVEKTIILYLYENNDTSSHIGNVTFTGDGNTIPLRNVFELYSTAKYMRLVGRYTHNMDIADIDDFLSDVLLYGVNNVLHDPTDTQGVLNVVKRTHQLTDIEYTPVADLPAQEDTYQADGYKILAGTSCTGMKYSSVRVEQLYVPQAVSLKTFMTALANPNSYLYTRESNVPNSKTYYGAVCSTFVAYAYGIDNVIPTTISFMNYPGFTPLPEYMQNPNSLKIGNMLNHAGSHIAIITDIIRDFSGKILLIETSDAWHPFMRRRLLSPEQIQTGYFDNGFKAYKYEYIDAVPYTPSPWVAVDDEEHTSPSTNGNLSPRRGEDANWRASENVEIDIIDVGTYTSYVVTERNTNAVVETHSIPSGNLIMLTGLSAGQYAVYLTDGTNNSDSVAFNVMDTVETYETIEDGVVRVSYQTDLGTPSAILWCNNNPTCYDRRAVRYFHVLTDEEIADGQATVNKPPIDELEYQDEEYEAPNGIWEMRVMYKTEFGLYTSDGEQVNVYY